MNFQLSYRSSLGEQQLVAPARSTTSGAGGATADKAPQGTPSFYLRERPRLLLDAELRLAELAEAGVGGRQPRLQAALVHRAQRARAVAGGQQVLHAATFVANAADGAVAGGRGAGVRVEENRREPGEADLRPDAETGDQTSSVGTNAPPTPGHCACGSWL